MEFKDGNTGQNNTYNESNLGEGSQYISKVDNLTIIKAHPDFSVAAHTDPHDRIN